MKSMKNRLKLFIDMFPINVHCFVLYISHNMNKVGSVVACCINNTEGIMLLLFLHRNRLSMNISKTSASQMQTLALKH